MTTKQYDLVIVGAGPAGMAAAAAAYDNGITDILLLDREPSPGGILRQCIHNGFGLHSLGQELTGPEYAAVYEDMLRQREIPVLCSTTVTEITPDRKVTAVNKDRILTLQAGAVILAMGCRERSRGALNISGSRPAGIFTAGTAQRLMNMDGYRVGNRVVILGSGDIGLIMARRLSLEGAAVEAVCELLPYSGGLTRNIVQCLEDFQIPLYLSTTVTQIHGKKRLEGVTVAQVDENRRPLPHTSRFIPCDTLLLSVGLIPENELTKAAGIPLDPVTGGAIVDENCMTQIPGIFACGNVLQVHDLVDYVSEEAQRAGIGAVQFLTKQARTGRKCAVEAGSGVRYVLPQTLTAGQLPISLFLRVTKPFGPVMLKGKSGERTILAKKLTRAAPGEMEKLILPADHLQDCGPVLTVEVEEL